MDLTVDSVKMEEYDLVEEVQLVRKKNYDFWKKNKIIIMNLFLLNLLIKFIHYYFFLFSRFYNISLVQFTN